MEIFTQISPQILLLSVFSTLFLNFILQFKVYRAPLDWDTSSHLYYAFLKQNKVNFISSYTFGIKYFLPVIYTFLFPLIKNRFYRFRIINILSSSLTILLLFYFMPEFHIEILPFFLLLILLMNSLWVDYETSAIEFHSPLIVLFICFIPRFIPYPFSFFIQIIILCVLISGFKITDSAYLFPVIIMTLNEHPVMRPLIIGTSFAFALFVLFILKFQKSSIRTYSKTRSLFHSKNKFIIINPLFIGILIWLVFQCILYSDYKANSLLFTALLILFIQRVFVTYFFYPIIVFCIYSLIISESYLDVSPVESWSFIFIIIFLHTIPHILMLNSKAIDVRMRFWVMFNRGYRNYLNYREEQVQWLKKNIIPNETVYLWGSNVYLLLNAELKHAPSTYYSHNHLFYWSPVIDKIKYAIDFIGKNLPGYIIVSDIVENSRFPKEKFEKKYSHIASIHNMDVFKRI